MTGQVRHGVGDPHAALAMLGEFERAAHRAPGALRILDLAGDLVEVRLAVMLVEHPAWGRTGPSGWGRHS